MAASQQESLFPPALVREAWEQSLSGDIAGTISRLESLLDKTPGLSAAHALLGDLYAAAGDPNEAANHWEQTLAQDLQQPRVLYSLGLSLISLNPRRARTLLEQARRFEPYSPEIAVAIDRLAAPPEERHPTLIDEDESALNQMLEGIVPGFSDETTEETLGSDTATDMTEESGSPAAETDDGAFDALLATLPDTGENLSSEEPEASQPEDLGLSMETMNALAGFQPSATPAESTDSVPAGDEDERPAETTVQSTTNAADTSPDDDFDLAALLPDEHTHAESKNSTDSAGSDAGDELLAALLADEEESLDADALAMLTNDGTIPHSAHPVADDDATPLDYSVLMGGKTDVVETPSSTTRSGSRDIDLGEEELAGLRYDARSIHGDDPILTSEERAELEALMTSAPDDTDMSSSLTANDHDDHGYGILTRDEIEHLSIAEVEPDSGDNNLASETREGIDYSDILSEYYGKESDEKSDTNLEDDIRSGFSDMGETSAELNGDSSSGFDDHLSKTFSAYEALKAEPASIPSLSDDQLTAIGDSLEEDTSDILDTAPETRPGLHEDTSTTTEPAAQPVSEPILSGPEPVAPSGEEPSGLDDLSTVSLDDLIDRYLVALHPTTPENAEEPFVRSTTEALRTHKPVITQTPPTQQHETQHSPEPTLAIESDDSDEDADETTVTMAEIYVGQGLVGRAIALYERILAQRPGDSAITRRIGVLRAQLDQHET